MKATHALPLLFAAVTGCRARDTSPEITVVDASLVVTEPIAQGVGGPPVPADAPKGPRRRGLVGMIFHASHDLGLPAEQSGAVDRIEEPLRRTEEGVKESLRAYEVERVAGIRAGKIDPARMQKRYAAIDEAARARQRGEAAALTDLRAEIGRSASQSLVLAVRVRRAAHALHPPDDPGTGPGDWTAERLERMTVDCVLDAEQRRQVAALLARSNLPTAAALQARRDVANRRADALLAAFVQEGFDAGAADLWLGIGASPHELLEREDAFLSKLLPILRPDQREHLAVSRENPPPEEPGTHL